MKSYLLSLLVLTFAVSGCSSSNSYNDLIVSLGDKIDEIETSSETDTQKREKIEEIYRKIDELRSKENSAVARLKPQPVGSIIADELDEDGFIIEKDKSKPASGFYIPKEADSLDMTLGSDMYVPPKPEYEDNGLEKIVLKRPQAQKPKTEIAKNKRELFGDISFANGSMSLSEGDKFKLKIVTSYLKRNDNVKLILEGFSSKEKNMTARQGLINLRLSVKRAEIVRDYIVTLGIPHNRVRVYGFGATNPHGFEEPNRRVAIWLLDKK